MQGTRRASPQGSPVRTPSVRKRKTSAEKEPEKQGETTTSPVRKRAKKDSVETAPERPGETVIQRQGGPDQIGEAGASTGSEGSGESEEEGSRESSEPEEENGNEVSAGEDPEWSSLVNWD